jgi:hypothetical protein
MPAVVRSSGCPFWSNCAGLLRVADSCSSKLATNLHAGLLEAIRGCDVVLIASSGGDEPLLLAGNLKLLEQKTSESLAPKKRRDFHVEVRVGWIVVGEETARGDDAAFPFYAPRALWLSRVRKDFVALVQHSKRRTFHLQASLLARRKERGPGCG